MVLMRPLQQTLRLIQSADPPTHPHLAQLSRQEPYFHYLFGVDEPGCYGAHDIRTCQAFLFVPRPSPDQEVWMGPVRNLTYYLQKYGVDEVHYVDEMATVLKQMAPPALHMLHGRDSDRCWGGVVCWGVVGGWRL